MSIRAFALSLGGTTGGGGGGNFGIGNAPSPAGIATGILYLDNSGNLTDDGSFTRDSATNVTNIQYNIAGRALRFNLSNSTGSNMAFMRSVDSVADILSSVGDSSSIGGDTESFFVRALDLSTSAKSTILSSRTALNLHIDDSTVNNLSEALMTTSSFNLRQTSSSTNVSQILMGGQWRADFTTAGGSRSFIIAGNGIFFKGQNDTFQLPETDGSANDVMVTDGNAILSFASISSVIGGPFLPLAGGTMTGAITLAADAVNPFEPVTFQQFSGAITGLKPKATVTAATVAPLPANLYNNGAAGVGATLTGVVLGALPAQDGVTLVLGDTLLVKNEVAPLNNGIYNVTVVGDVVTAYVLTRRTDLDNASEGDGAIIPVLSGTTNGQKSFIQTVNPSTVGATSLVFAMFNNNIYTADGLGIELLGGNIFSLEIDGTTLSKSATGIKVATGGITNTEVSAIAAISRSKLASGTANRIVVNDGAGVMVDAAAITAARALISDANGIPTQSAVTSAELAFVGGVTSNIQTQFTNVDLLTHVNKKSTVFDDFVGVTLLTVFSTFTSGTAGAGTGQAAPLVGDNAVGIATFQTGTVATGRCGIDGYNAAVIKGVADTTFFARAVLPVLSDNTNNYTVRIGFNTVLVGDGNGTYFRYNHAVNGGRWQYVTRQGATETATDTGIAVVAGTWYRLESLLPIAGTSAIGSINGTVVATNTTNLPLGAIGVCGFIQKTVGTTSRQMNLDYIGLTSIFSGTGR